ncbi:LuxR C-terminal-related transcriptional regulator [Streptomyces bambusae]|uniref:helix-turn-helix transcriptional regulator n=1 Tax=Streptomyces bambusae TaxID=1550616 RepID=UPI001CFF3075|nr:LuxR C-terminal-related transcriptional regulator [Streptomyces bambusae]MCB5167525.1 LuxR C-terminal-related transcriptional regulator [Streptomyces bambusae]
MPAPVRGPGPADPLLAAKLAVPLQAPGLVRRDRLLHRLTLGAQGPLTLVTGGAGVGKTVLAASWAAARPPAAPTVWLTAEPEDTPGVFWAYLVEGLRRGGALAGADLGTPVRAADVDRSLFVRLAAALERLPEPLVLVVDGLDDRTGRSVYDGLRFLVEHAGPALRTVLLGRADPPLPLHRYRADGRLHEIRERDLAFTRSEAGALLAGHLRRQPAPAPAPDSDDLVDVLFRHTEGWAAGLRLCALAMARTDDPAAFARSLTASEQAVSDYLLAEVLAVQPAPARDLLLRTAVLSRVHPGLAAALTGRPDAERTLEDLAHRHAFVEPLAGTRWYRFHPLFAAVLRAHLRSRHPDLEPRLHCRAARWYAARGQPSDAVAEAAAGGDWRLAAELTVRNLLVGPLLVDPGAIPSADTFTAMPPDPPGPAAHLVAAARCLTRDDPAAARSHLSAAAGPGRGRPDASPAPDGGDRLAAQLTLALLRLLSLPDGPAEREAEQITGLLDRLTPEERARHPELEPLRRYGLGCARLRTGAVQAARQELEQAARACPGDDPLVLLRHKILGRLALADAAAGALARAREHGAAAYGLADRHGIPDAHRSGAAGLALAAVAVEQGDLVAAVAHLDRTALAPDTGRDPDLDAERLVLTARLELARGRKQAARTLLDAHPGTGVRLALARAGAALAQGDHAAADRALQHLPAALPARRILLARAHLAAGQPARARPLLDAAAQPGPSEATPADLVGLALARARLALAGGDEDTARARLAEALAAARPELLRQPFTEAGPWVRHLAGPSGVHAWLTAAPAAAPTAATEPLSPRETEVLRHAARMMSTEEIAAELRLSVNTVKTHLRGAYRKLCVSRRRDAVDRARELHLL